jgi:hypothetical protein
VAARHGIVAIKEGVVLGWRCRGLIGLHPRCDSLLHGRAANAEGWGRQSEEKGRARRRGVETKRSRALTKRAPSARGKAYPLPPHTPYALSIPPPCASQCVWQDTIKAPLPGAEDFAALTKETLVVK